MFTAYNPFAGGATGLVDQEAYASPGGPVAQVFQVFNDTTNTATTGQFDYDGLITNSHLLPFPNQPPGR
jgi:hypothetical protein